MNDKSTFYLVREEILPEAIKKTIKVKEILKRGLHEQIDDLQTRMNKVGEAVHGTFFAMRPVDEAEKTGEVVDPRTSFPPPGGAREIQ